MRLFVVAAFVFAVLTSPVMADQPSPSPSVMPSASPAATVFTPPQGWTPMPSYFLVSPAMWNDAAGATITIVPLPALNANFLNSPLFSRMMATSLRSALSGVGHVQTSSTVSTLCGSPGRIMRFATRAHASPAIDAILEASGNRVYLMLYTHLHSAGDPRVEHALRVLCPSPAHAISDLTLPSGWTKKPTMRIVAEWLGPALGTTIVETTGTPMPSLDALMSLAHKANAHSISHAVKQTCGMPALEEQVAVNSSLAHVQVDILALQTAKASYVLTYTSQASLDPNVLASMHAFCPP
jgi:hypothetical protein